MHLRGSEGGRHFTNITAVPIVNIAIANTRRAYGQPLSKIIGMVSGSHLEAPALKTRSKRRLFLAGLIDFLAIFVVFPVCVVAFFFADLFLLPLVTRALGSGSDFLSRVVLYVSPYAGLLLAFGPILYLTRVARRMRQPSLREILEYDHRKPIVYLRSFKDDEKKLLSLQEAASSIAFDYLVSGRSLLASGMTFVSKTQKFDNVAREVYSPFGRFVGLASPGSAQPASGFAHVNEDGDGWKNAIGNLIKTSRFVCVVPDSSANVRWEIDFALRTKPIEHVHFLFPYSTGADIEDLSFILDCIYRDPSAKICAEGLRAAIVELKGREHRVRGLHFVADSGAKFLMARGTGSTIVLSALRIMLYSSLQSRMETD